MQYHLLLRVLLCFLASMTCSLVQSQTPSAPRRISFSSVIEDLRPGFEGHAVITLAWDRPEEGVEGLTGYNLTVRRVFAIPDFPGACGNETENYLLPESATSYDVMAASPGWLPQFGPGRQKTFCRYAFKLTSLPGTSTASINFAPLKPVDVTSPPQPVVNFTCDRIVDEATGLLTFHLQWSYMHENISYIQEAIKAYQVRFELLKIYDSGVELFPGGTAVLNATLSHQTGTLISIDDNTEVVCPDGVATYAFNLTLTNEAATGDYLLIGLCPQDITLSNSTYRIIFNFLRDDFNLWWRPHPSPAQLECAISAHPERPGVVSMETVNILDEPPLKLQQVEGKEKYDVTLGLSWDPPLNPYGADEYEVYIGDRPQGSIDIANPFIIDGIQGTNVILQGEVISVSEGSVCILVQIRSSNEFLQSEWSEPLMIPLFPDNYPDCMKTGGEDPGGKDSGGEDEETSFPAYAIALVVVGLVLLLLAVVAVLVLCAISYQRKRFTYTIKGSAGSDQVIPVPPEKEDQHSDIRMKGPSSTNIMSATSNPYV